MRSSSLLKRQKALFIGTSHIRLSTLVAPKSFLKSSVSLSFLPYLPLLIERGSIEVSKFDGSNKSSKASVGIGKEIKGIFPNWGEKKVQSLLSKPEGHQLLKDLNEGNYDKCISTFGDKCIQNFIQFRGQPDSEFKLLEQIHKLPYSFIREKFEKAKTFENCLLKYPYETSLLLIGLRVIAGNRRIDHLKMQQCLNIQKKMFPSSTSLPLSNEQNVRLLVKDIICRHGEQYCLPLSKIMEEMSFEVQEQLQFTLPKSIEELQLILKEDSNNFGVYKGTVYLKEYFELEKFVAQLLVKIIDSGREKTTSKLVPIENNQLKQSEEQRKAIELALNSKLFLLTGKPGSGKSQCLVNIVKSLKENGKKVLVGTFTGRNANNLKLLGCSEAMTLHHILHAKEGSDPPKFFAPNNFDVDVFIIDEAPLVELILFKEVLRRLPDHASLILIGDPNQISSMDPGNVFLDLLNDDLEELIPRVKLTQTHRQKGRFATVLTEISNKILQGINPKKHLLSEQNQDIVVDRTDNITKDTMFGWFRGTKLEESLRKLLHLFPTDQVQVLVNMKAPQINEEIRHLFNPRSKFGVTSNTNSSPYSMKTCEIGDRVMHVKNERKLYLTNGEIGKIISITGSSIGVEYPDSKIIGYDRNTINDLKLCYAMTVQKSQGCEFPIVVVYLMHDVEWTKQMLYTAFTRAKERLFVIEWQDWIVNKIVRTSQMKYSNLGSRVLEIVQDVNSKLDPNEKFPNTKYFPSFRPEMVSVVADEDDGKGDENKQVIPSKQLLTDPSTTLPSASDLFKGDGEMMKSELNFSLDNMIENKKETRLDEQTRAISSFPSISDLFNDTNLMSNRFEEFSVSTHLPNLENVKKTRTKSVSKKETSSKKIKVIEETAMDEDKTIIINEKPEMKFNQEETVFKNVEEVTVKIPGGGEYCCEGFRKRGRCIHSDTENRPRILKPISTISEVSSILEEKPLKLIEEDSNEQVEKNILTCTCRGFRERGTCLHIDKQRDELKKRDKLDSTVIGRNTKTV